MNDTILPTGNAHWGFHGTIARSEATAVDPDAAWALASDAVLEATGVSPEGARDFLDSRHGRHFADDVANGLGQGLDVPRAIDAAIERWMGWRIDRRTSRDTGIPAGLPYLTGFSARFEIMAEGD